MATEIEIENIWIGLKPTPSSYLKTAREIAAGAIDDLQPVNVALLSTFTSEILSPYLIVECARRGLIADLYFAPFNQLEQQVLDSGGPLYRSQPDFVVLATRLEEIAPRLVERFVSLSADEIENEMAAIHQRLSGLLEGLRRSTKATVFLFDFASPIRLAAGLADSTLERSQPSVVQQANDLLAGLCQQYPDVHLFDYSRLVQSTGQDNWQDPKLWYLGRIPLGAEAQLKTGQQLARYIRAASFPPAKCLVVDLDNTLWGGVLGEEGIGGIKLSDDYPGNVYKEFQRQILALRDRGILLAIASKNNKADVEEAFAKHPDLVLKLDDFSARQIHWEDKASSLEAIAEELNIGIDSLVFFDDSPVERDWVRSRLPGVTVVDVPETPLEYADALESSEVFDFLTISAEDRMRAGMYQSEHGRRQLQKSSVSLEEFLKQLETKATVGRLDRDTLPRVAQLMAKTNQFNLTNRRHTASDLQEMVAAGAVALWLRVADKYGDNGLVGVGIAVPEDSTRWTIDSFIMSCRVFGRHVETALLSGLTREIKERGGSTLVGEYIPTAKNVMVANLYPDHGFVTVNGSGERWEWDLSTGEIPPPDMVTIQFEGSS